MSPEIDDIASFDTTFGTCNYFSKSVKERVVVHQTVYSLRTFIKQVACDMYKLGFSHKNINFFDHIFLTLEVSEKNSKSVEFGEISTVEHK